MSKHIPYPLLHLRAGRAVAQSWMETLGFALFLVARFAWAQANLGELLDAGATQMTSDDFKRELVQRTVFGPSASGGSLEVIYVGNGLIEGRGTTPRAVSNLQPTVRISGRWTVDSEGRICTTLQFLGGDQGGPTLVYPTAFPPRCQYWFKAGDAYFISDYDSDRSAKVLRRTVVQ